jgi:hypothetical protein
LSDVAARSAFSDFTNGPRRLWRVRDGPCGSRCWSDSGQAGCRMWHATSLRLAVRRRQVSSPVHFPTSVKHLYGLERDQGSNRPFFQPR